VGHRSCASLNNNIPSFLRRQPSADGRIHHENMKKVQYSYVYVMASKRYGTLYIGVTGDLVARVYEHKNDLVDGFTKKYQIHTLVYYKQFEDIEAAILEEKRLKKWKREWKIRLIEEKNPGWRDLYGDIV
jgi:putative endonuclease